MTALNDPGWRCVRPPQTPDLRLQERWQRLWLEARRSHGDDALAAARATTDSTLCTLLFALDRQADAVVLPPDDGGAAAWGLLQPRSVRPCADVYWASLPAVGEFGWMPWPASDFSVAVPAVPVAADLLGARPVWVNFRASESRVPSTWQAAQAMLAARLPLDTLDLYSPLFFGDGRLLAAALVQKIVVHRRGAIPLVLIPGLGTAEFATAVRSASGAWAGPIRLGAAIPAARLDPAGKASDIQLALALLTRLAQA